MKRFAYIAILVFTALTINAEEYTIIFNSSTFDSSKACDDLESIVYLSSENCVNQIISAEKVYRAKEDFGIKFGTASIGGNISIGLSTTYDIQSMTVYAAAYGGNNKDSINPICVNNDTIQFTKGVATIITPYSVKAPRETDKIVISSTKAKNNRFYIQKIVFTAPDPFPDMAKITTPSNVDFGSAVFENGQTEIDAIDINIQTRSTTNDSLLLQLRYGTVFSISTTKLPYYGGNVNIAYSVSSAPDAGKTIKDSLIISAKGLDNNIVRKAIPIILYVKNYKPSSTPADSSCMRIGRMPCNYYHPAQGLKDEELMLALSEIIHCGPRYRYGSGFHRTWHGFFFTDRDTLTQEVLDMYSNTKRYFNIEDTTASVAGYDIEHMLPKSWWGGDVNEAYCDLFHLVPADYSANRSKSNNAPGTPADSTFNNGSFVTGSGENYGLNRVFCPADEYKGDFARAYFYIVTCYKELEWVTTGIAGKSMTNDSYLEFRPWLQELLIGWHRMDPVSEKEKARAIQVNKIQGNRNPYIDYPELAEYIWGNMQGQTVDFKLLTQTYGDPYCDTIIDQIPEVIPPDTIEPEGRITPIKIIYNSHLFILLGNKVYDAMGSLHELTNSKPMIE